MTNEEIKLNNHDRYTGAFNTLHEVLQEKLNKKDRNFGQLIIYGKNNNDKIINHYHDDFDFHREFRNILTHSHTQNKPPVAEPSDAIINDLNTLINKIKYPKKANEVFLSEVKHFNENDSLAEVLQVVSNTQYSQFPIFNDEKLVGLLTENGITQFLSNSVKDDIISISETTVGDIIKVDEGKESLTIVNSNTLLYDINEEFRRNLNNGNSIFAILISSRGRKIENPDDIKGIITPWDLPKVLKNI